MFKKKKEKPSKQSTTPFESRKPTLKEIEEMFVSDDYPLKGKSPYKKL